MNSKPRLWSALKTGAVNGAALFALVRGGSAVEFGSAVHAMLAEIEWWDLTRGGESAKKTMATLEASGEAGVEAAGCLRAAALAGDDIYVSGTLGDARLALEVFRGGVALDAAAFTRVRERMERPTPRLALRE